MTVEGGLGGAAGFTAGAAAVFVALLESVAGVVVVVVVVVAAVGVAGLVSAGLPVAGAATGAAFISIGGADCFLPNIGDQAKPIRGAKLKLLLMLVWFS